MININRCQNGKYIYKIINLLDGKIYIGQSVDVKTRWSKHIHNDSDNSLIHQAIKRDGVENFSFEIIDEGLNYNDLEDKYIKLYQSNNPNYGYNIVCAGQMPLELCIRGEQSSAAKLTNQQVEEIKTLLKSDTPYKLTDLAKQFNITKTAIRAINEGFNWYSDGDNYPLQKQTYHTTIAQEIKNLLKTTKLTQKEIALQFDVDESHVSHINVGDYYWEENICYPIRQWKLTMNSVLEIINDILFTDLPLTKIGKKYNVSNTTISKINAGNVHKKENLIYPLRKHLVINKKNYTNNL